VEEGGEEGLSFIVRPLALPPDISSAPGEFRKVGHLTFRAFSCNKPYRTEVRLGLARPANKMKRHCVWKEWREHRWQQQVASELKRLSLV